MTSDKRKAVNWLKAGAWVVGIALLLFVGLIAFTTWLQHKLERMAYKQSDGLYTLQLHGFEVSPFTGRLAADSLQLTPNYKRWQQLQAESAEAPRMLLGIRTNSFTTDGLNLGGLVLGKPLKAETLEIIAPAILLTAMRPDTTERQAAAHETATGLMKGMQIGNIKVKDARLRYRQNYSKANYLFNLDRFNIEAQNFKLDSQSYNDPGRTFYTNNIAFNGKQASYQFPDGLYRATIDSIALNTKKQSFSAHSFYLKPLRTARQMSVAKGKSVTSNDLKVDALLMKGVNYSAYFKNHQFIVQHITVENPALKVFKNRKTGHPEKEKPTLHELAQQIKTPFLVDTLEVKNGRVRYSELAPEGSKPGFIRLSNMKGMATNVSNMPEHMSDKKPAVLRSEFLVMEKAAVQVTVTLPLLNKAGYHTIKGYIGEARPAILNPILVPVSFIKIEKGYLRKGEFNAELTARKGTGNMLVYYNNLEVELLNKGEGGDQGLGKKVLSEVADWVAIKDANPMKDEKPRTGNISVTRDPTKSILDYWKNCVVSGFLSTMGLEKISQK